LASTQSYIWIQFSSAGHSACSLILASSFLGLIFDLNMEAVCPSETSVNLRFTSWQHYQKISLIAVTDVRPSVQNHDP
jgi:hypothetical protein